MSGRAAVAACLGVVLLSATPAWVRPILVLAAVGAGISRIVYGVHLPVDVSGGWAVGTLVGLAGSAMAKAAPGPVPLRRQTRLQTPTTSINR